MNIERKICARSLLKVLDEGPGKLTGYASVFGDVDRVNERTVRGCFTKTLGDFVRDGFLSWGHDWGRPVATIAEAVEDDRGLLLTAEFHSTDDGQQARRWTVERLERSKSAGLSIGYKTLRKADGADGVTDLTELELFEVGITPVPCLPSAQAFSAKDGLHAGLSFADHSESVLAAVEELKARAADIEGLRAKEGRTLSEANRSRLGTLCEMMRSAADDLEAFLTATTPPEKADETMIQNAIARWADLSVRLAQEQAHAYSY